MSPLAQLPVFFLSDYGLDDEFVGVVHAVLHRQAPGAPVVDLAHRVRHFDVRAGAEALWRAAPHLGPGVVLGVVDPGVGTDRRCVALEIETTAGPRWWVGPDNGLLVAGAEAVGRPLRAAVLPVPGVAEPPGPGAAPVATTFDGRDVMAPAAALLAVHQTLEELGRGGPLQRVGPEQLVRLPPRHLEVSADAGGRRLRAEVTWIDHFGNVQLVAGTDRLTADVGEVEVHCAHGAHRARRVSSFGELGPGELGVLGDANGRLALVCNRQAARDLVGVGEGDVVELCWRRVRA